MNGVMKHEANGNGCCHLLNCEMRFHEVAQIITKISPTTTSKGRASAFRFATNTNKTAMANMDEASTANRRLSTMDLAETMLNPRAARIAPIAAM